MKIAALKTIYFSPTGTTRKVVEVVAEGFGADTLEPFDLTPPKARARNYKELRDELVLIGMPVYGGRVPADAIGRLGRFKASGTPAVIIVVYGNRKYEDALLELNNLAREIGFRPVAGGVFIGEHSFSSDDYPIASGRPDAEDLKKARKFGEDLRLFLKNFEVIGDIPPLYVPGNFPHVEHPAAKDGLKMAPITREALCIKCGTCAKVCPTAAIILNDSVITDENACITCCACVKNCPSRARAMDSPQVQKTAEFLSKRCQERKEPEIFLAR